MVSTGLSSAGRGFFFLLIAGAGIALFSRASAQDQPPKPKSADAPPGTVSQADPPDPSKWHGFNLDAKAGRDAAHQQPYREDDFRMIAELGFNFVRLPIDYRVWLQDGKDPKEMNPAVIAEIDQAIAWGKKYGIHVDLSMWRAPGYGVNKIPTDDPPLWTDPGQQELFLTYWRFFAQRYKDIPSAELSFNLLNEPEHIDPSVYVPIARRACAAIWEISPRRLIFSDGMPTKQSRGHRLPVPGLEEGPFLWQSDHAYEPGWLTSYGETWHPVQDAFGVVPHWPVPVLSGLITGPGQSHLPGVPLVINLKNFPGGAFRLRIYRYDGDGTTLRVTGDDAELAKWVMEPPAQPAPPANPPDSKIVVNRDYAVAVPSGTKQLRVEITQGNRIDFGAFGFKVPGRDEESVMVTDRSFREVGGPVSVDFASPEPIQTGVLTNADWLLNTVFASWIPLGKHFFIGEFGCFNRTPHDTTLAWMEDDLRVFNKLGVGFALWEFRGPFGVMDSGRKDVAYENFEGHQLDRKMVDLLQKYAK